jgi:hypothetical protein
MTKTKKIAYWIATLWLSLGMVATAIGQLLKTKTGQGGADSLSHLGFPLYLLTILGIWKISGVVAVLIPRFPIVKEWAYAGFFFIMSGAMASHIVMGDAVAKVLPSLLLLVLTITSWYLRPADRKLTNSKQH